MYTFAALSILGLTTVATAACTICPEASCQRCLGPDNFSGNPPVCPFGCNGDIEVTFAAFYWSAHQDGMEYGLFNHVTNPYFFPELNLDNNELNQLVEAEYKHPRTRWDWGFKVGLGYCSPCDGWDVNLQWTWFDLHSSNHTDADFDDNVSFLPIWSNFVTQYANAGNVGLVNGDVLAATDAVSKWKLKLNLVDLELGRDFWVSKYLAVRPFAGIRYASIKQSNNLEYNGCSWAQANVTFNEDNYTQPSFKGLVDLQNDYRGAGLRGGLGCEWNFGCGWSLYGNGAASIIYGKFKIHQNEDIRVASTSPHSVANILSASESLRASRAILDMALGVQYKTMFCSCKYGLTASLGWEQHMFFDQNQLWRVNRVGASATPNTPTTGLNALDLNVSGSNVFHENRGSLETQGWTLAVRLDY